MFSDALSKVVGTPVEGVTHWGIQRMVAGKGQRLDHPNDDNVRVREWPLDELSLDLIRARWGSGSFKILWLSPDNPDVQRRSGGWSPLFTLDPEQAVHVAAPLPAAPTLPAMPIAAQPNGVSASDLLQVMTTMMQLSDKRSEAFLSAVMQRNDQGGSDAATHREMSQLRADLAATNARLEADKREREIEQRHRDELAKKDAEIARIQREKEAEVAKLQREKEEAEREAERETPRIDPGQPILSQIGYGVMNAAMAKPELVGKVLEVASPFVEKLMGGGAVAGPPAKAPSNGAPAPRALHGEVGRPNDDPKRAPTVPVVRVGEPVKPAAAPKPAAEPEVTVAPSQPVPGADPANSSWQPIGNAKGEEKKAEPAAAAG